MGAPYRSTIAPRTRLRRTLARAYSRAMIQRHFNGEKPIAAQRAAVARQDRLLRAPRGIEAREIRVGGVPCVRLHNRNARGERTILYLHGGGFVLGSPATVRDLAGRLALAAGAHAVLADYALAPERRYPAALEDCAAVYGALVGSGVAPSELSVAGDSAGGNLSALLAQRLRDKGGERPACLYMISPSTDLSLSGESMATRADVDPMLSSAWIRQCVDAYLGDTPPRIPGASPLFADHAELPPTLIQVGSDEILLSDAERYAARSFDAGVDATLEVWNGLFHDFQLFGLILPEARDALGRAGHFIRKHSS
jgi:monoterpene epsilon-lactone hydrolase